MVLSNRGIAQWFGLTVASMYEASSNHVNSMIALL
jgi:hypothetical protein